MSYFLCEAKEMKVYRPLGFRPISHPNRVRGSEMSAVLSFRGFFFPRLTC